MLLSVIVLTHNSASIIETCITSILKECEKLKFEIIVVDNNSSDKTAFILENNYPGIKLLINKKNLGVAAARNIGIKASSGRYILLLDDDIVVHKNSITA
ncbi:MAG: glycosyltransferase, partial [Bacteroidales bacterium]|nr:glycosyltransferase [Bacteroidales bacterium]